MQILLFAPPLLQMTRCAPIAPRGTFLNVVTFFRDVYLNSYLVGEGMSGFVPSIVALAQVSLENEASSVQSGFLNFVSIFI